MNMILNPLRSYNMEKNTGKGLSFLICIGKWGDIKFSINNTSIRLCLGFISFDIIFYDVEVILQKIIKKYNIK